MSAAVSVRMHAPAFTAGDRVSATITLSRPPAEANARPRPRRVAYVVAQVAGRWVSDRSWLRPGVHAAGGHAPPGALDLHDPAGAPWDAALDDAFHAGGSGAAAGSRSSAGATGGMFAGGAGLLAASLSSSALTGSSSRPRSTGSASGPVRGLAGGSAALGHTGVVFRSAALSVCADEPLPPGALIGFDVQCVLPEPIPATLRGTAMRYAYALIVVVAPEDPAAAPHIIRVPFRVVPRDEAANLSMPLPASDPGEARASGDSARDGDADAPAESSSLSGSSTSGTVSAPRVPLPAKTEPSASSRTGLIIPVPTPADTGPAPSRFLQAAPASALTMAVYRSKPPAPTDIEIALALSRNGRLTPYRTDEELWKHGSTGLDDDSALSLIRYVPPSPALDKSPGAAVSAKATSLGEHSISHRTATTSRGSPHHTLSPHGRPSPPQTPKFAAVHGGRSSAFPGDTLSGAERAQRKSSRSSALPVYQISRGPNPLARLHLQRRVHYLGEPLTAVFDFLGSSFNRVYRLNARLECQEVVHAAYTLGANGDGDFHSGLVFRKVYGEHGEFVMHNQNTHVTFSIPHDAPVTFATSVVQVRWLLHFTFLIPRHGPTNSDTKDRRESPVRNASAEDRRIPLTDAEVDGDRDSRSHDASSSMDVPTIEADALFRDDERGSEAVAGVVGDDDVAVPEQERLIDGHQEDERAPAGRSKDSRDNDGDSDDETPEWLGGDWRGEGGSACPQLLPEHETEALHWTLPLVVTSRQGSHWGPCPAAQLQLDR